MIETPSITILKNNSQIKKTKAKSMKYIVRIRKPIPFFLKIEVEMMIKLRFFESDMVSLREVNGENNEQSQKFEGKLKKILKLSLKRKTPVFRD